MMSGSQTNVLDFWNQIKKGDMFPGFKPCLCFVAVFFKKLQKFNLAAKLCSGTEDA